MMNGFKLLITTVFFVFLNNKCQEVMFGMFSGCKPVGNE